MSQRPWRGLCQSGQSRSWVLERDHRSGTTERIGALITRFFCLNLGRHLLGCARRGSHVAGETDMARTPFVAALAVCALSGAAAADITLDLTTGPTASG